MLRILCCLFVCLHGFEPWTPWLWVVNLDPFFVFFIRDWFYSWDKGIVQDNSYCKFYCDHSLHNKNLLTKILHSSELIIFYLLISAWLVNFKIIYRALASLDNASRYINFENFGDIRQSKFESIYDGTISSPNFKDIYAPLEGFNANAGLKIRLWLK